MSTTATAGAGATAGATARTAVRRARAVGVAAVLLVGVLLVREELAGPVRITSQSMAPSLERGDVVLVDRRPVPVAGLRHGDLVTFESPLDGQETLKRVVALPGETVVVLDAVLHVDGRPVEEPYVDRREWDGMFTAQVTVPDDSVYVLGDDRLRSVDSRDHGPVRANLLSGRVLTRVWPPGGPLTEDAPTAPPTRLRPGSTP